MTTKPTSPLMRYHGAKWRLAPWILSFFPPHKYYVEAFGGSAAVLFQKPRSHGEVYNDLDQDIFNLFRVLRDNEKRQQLQMLCELTPFSRDEFLLCYEPTNDPVEKARRTIFRAYAGFGSASATKGKSGFRTDIFRNYKNPCHIWQEVPTKLKTFSDRLLGVQIENKNAIEVIEKYDTEETLFYLDPPYVLSTRESRGCGAYRKEMTDENHEQLIEQVLSLKGMVILSGYQNEIYDRLIDEGWHREQTNAWAAQNRGTAMRTESLWLNPHAMEKSQQQLFKFK